jgi:hypothetical protein
VVGLRMTRVHFPHLPSLQITFTLIGTSINITSYFFKLILGKNWIKGRQNCVIKNWAKCKLLTISVDRFIKWKGSKCS